MRKSEAKIAIGPRSAIFAPCKKLGMIIVDEEHEGTYKSEQTPRYHAVDVARIRSRIEGARLLLGSATPTIDSYYHAMKGMTKIISLDERVAGGTVPMVRLVDMRQELREGNQTAFSQLLIESLGRCLESGHQAILLLNRRAYATYVHCLFCGTVIHCEQCDISMKWHKKAGRLKCHYCGSQKAVPSQCPACQKKLSFQGAGTQKIEETLQELIPGCRIDRMDQDSMRGKDAHNKALTRFEKKEIDVLIGTQMIAKGLDFPNVTLVGILSADTSLNIPDFRAAERTFQLITQVAGRSGRGNSPGSVVLQTYRPDHYAVKHAARQNYEAFFAEEIRIREEHRYPPFVPLVQLVFFGKTEVRVADSAHKVAEGMKYLIDREVGKPDSGIIFGPTPALIGKAENMHRYSLLLKADGFSPSILKQMVQFLLFDKRENLVSQDVSVSIDVDPQFIA